jgi:hypothetical protein
MTPVKKRVLTGVAVTLAAAIALCACNGSGGDHPSPPAGGAGTTVHGNTLNPPCVPGGACNVPPGTTVVWP